MGVIDGVLGLVGTGIQAGVQVQENKKNRAQEREMLGLQQGYNEQAANRADERTRALYNDLYSPQAKVQQLKNAGLSVGLMYGTGGAGGTTSTSGAQAAPASQQAQSQKSPLENANLGLLMSQIAVNAAQAKKLNTEAEDKKLDVKGKEREWEWSEKHAIQEVTINVNNKRITELRDTGLSKWEIKRELEYKRDKAFDYLQQNKYDNERWLEVYRGITNEDSKDNLIEEYKSKISLLKNQELQSQFETKLQEYKKKSVTDLLDLMKNGIDTGNKTIDAVLKSAIPIMVMSMLKQ